MAYKKISFVLPVYNEQTNIHALYHQLTLVIEQISDCYEYEIIFVNDGSKDDSWLVIQELAYKDNHIKAINFSRNFGHQIALSAGYHYANGDAVISLDADMQHPPEMIPKMIEAWQQGYDIVYVQNIQRNDNFLKKVTALGYYRFLTMLSDS